MVFYAANTNGLAFLIIQNAFYVCMDFGEIVFGEKITAIFRAEYNVQVYF